MISKQQWFFRQLRKKLWFRASLFAVAGLLTALFSVFFSPALPISLGQKIGADAVDNILGILASSMLAVTTFSLSTMVTAFGAATTNGTPRASTLVVEDPTTQNVLAVFLGSFLFSLVGIIALSAGAYGEQGRTILFLVTLVDIAIIIMTMLRWIDHLSSLGRVADTIARVDNVVRNALKQRVERPCLGGRPAGEIDMFPTINSKIYHSRELGYLRHIDIAAVNRLAEEAEVTIHLLVLPGHHIDPTRAVAWSREPLGEEREAELLDSFTIDTTRSFDQDPRFGLSVMSEIASRALSSAVNDPGTAIHVLSRLLSLFWLYLDPEEDASCYKPEYEHVTVPSLADSDLFDDAFAPIGRDGAGIYEVQIRLQKTLEALARINPQIAAIAQAQSERALAYSQTAVGAESQRIELQRVADQIASLARRDEVSEG